LDFQNIVKKMVLHTTIMMQLLKIAINGKLKFDLIKYFNYFQTISECINGLWICDTDQQRCLIDVKMLDNINIAKYRL
jgi:hypothetical protein